MKLKAALTLLILTLIYSIPSITKTKSFIAGEHIPRDIIIKYKNDTKKRFEKNLSYKTNSALSSRYNSRSVSKLRKIGIEHIKIGKNQNLLKTIDEINEMEDVEYAEPDYLLQPTGIIRSNNKPQTLPRISSLPWGLKQIEAPNAWETTRGKENVVVAIIDTGIDYTHPDLRENIWRNKKEISNDNKDNDGNGYIDDVFGWNFADNNNDPFDDSDHGTHVAGIVGSHGLNVSGVTRIVKLMPLKFIGRSGYGKTSDAIKSILYAVENGAKILNNSWGGSNYSNALKDAIDYSNSKDTIFVAAAGNSSENNDAYPNYPSSYPVSNIISVGASTYSDHETYFSNYGKKSVHVMAPGENIYSTTINNYDVLSGTSMASPFVSGIAALLLSQNYSLDNYNVKRIIMESTEKFDQLKNITLTSGRVNADKALLLAKINPRGKSKFPMVPTSSQHEVTPAYGCGRTENNTKSNQTILFLILIIPLALIIKKKKCYAL